MQSLYFRLPLGEPSYPWQLPPQARGELGGGTTEEEFKETIEKTQIGVKYFRIEKR